MDQEQPIANEAPSTGQGAPVAEASSNQEPVYDVDGEKVPVSKIKEWKSGHLMQSDYTRKTQELATIRQQYEPYKQVHDYVQQNPDKWAEIQKIVDPYAGQPQQPYIDPEVQRVAIQNQRLQSQLTSLQLKTMLSDVKQDPKYGGIFQDPDMENLLLEKMLARPDVNTNPNVHREAAEKLHEFINKSRAKAILEGEEKVKKEIQGRPTAGKGTMTPPAKFDPAKASKKELRNVAMEMLS